MGKRKRKRKSMIMIFLVAIICGGIAFAWYEISNKADTTGLNLNASSTEGIEVYMKIESFDDGSGAGPVTKMLMAEINDNGATIDIGLEQLTNIEAGMIAPGSYGEFHFYITTPTIDINAYEINIIPKFDIHSDYDEDTEEILEVIENHILFFATKDGNDYGDKLRIDDIANDEEDGYINGNKQVAEGELELNVEKEVVVYWYWPYEYADVPGVDVGDITEENIRKYDLEDTLMGNYLNSFRLHFEVKGKKQYD